MDVFEAIKNRRSIRRYKPDPIDDEAVEAILEAGRWAPSWANTQCWRFIVVRDPEIRAKLTSSLKKIRRADGESDNPATRAMGTVPVVIVVCARMGRSGYSHHTDIREFDTDKGDWFMFDTALAVQNMVLAAHALGLGTVIIGAFDAPLVEKALHVPEGYRVVALFPVGVPDQGGKDPGRKELNEITYRDRWD
jgi:nitroreductase